jgi:hypothetical protein
MAVDLDLDLDLALALPAADAVLPAAFGSAALATGVALAKA